MNEWDEIVIEWEIGNVGFMWTKRSVLWAIIGFANIAIMVLIGVI